MSKKAVLQKIGHWLVEFIAACVVIAAGAALLVLLPETKQGQIQTAVYTGSPGWAVVIIGALGVVNSVRRGLFRKKP